MKKKVNNNTYDYKTSPLSFKINLYWTTLVTTCDNFIDDIPKNYFNDFAMIL